MDMIWPLLKAVQSRLVITPVFRNRHVPHVERTVDHQLTNSAQTSNWLDPVNMQAKQQTPSSSQGDKLPEFKIHVSKRSASQCSERSTPNHWAHCISCRTHPMKKMYCVASSCIARSITALQHWAVRPRHSSLISDVLRIALLARRLPVRPIFILIIHLKVHPSLVSMN